MSDSNIDHQESREHIDVKIGSPSYHSKQQNSDRDLQEEILKILKKQALYMEQIKNILVFFFVIVIIIIVLVLALVQ